MTTGFLTPASAVVCGLIAALACRMLLGPTAFDRLLAFNGITTQAIVLLLLIGTGFDRLALFLDIAFVYAMLSLVGSIAAVKYLQRLDHSS